ncbi:unnamed protein product [Closterium sp. NIES-54]
MLARSLAPVVVVISAWCVPNVRVGGIKVMDTLEGRLEDARRRHEAQEYGVIPWAVIEAGLRSVWAAEHPPSRPASPRPVTNEGGIDVGVNAGDDQVGSSAGGMSMQRGVIHADEVGGVQTRGMRSTAAAGTSQGDVRGRRSGLSPMSATQVTAGGIAPSYGYFKFTPDRILVTPPLVGRPDILTWKEAIEPQLEMAGLIGFARGTVATPEEHHADLRAEFRATRGMRSTAAAGTSQGDVRGRRSGLSPMSATQVTAGGIAPSYGYFKFTPDRILVTPPLVGRPDILTWKEAIEPQLEMAGLIGFARGTVATPEEHHADLRAEFRAVQLLTFTVMSRCCSPGVQIALKWCREYLDAGHRAWHFIESTYQVTDDLFIAQLEGQLTHLRMGDEETATDYCNRARRILATIRMAGAQYSTALSVTHVMQGLSRSYNLLKRLSMAPSTRTTLNEDNLASYILQDEAMQEAERSQELLAQAKFIAPAKQGGRPGGQGGGGRCRECWLCGDPDHLSFECPDRSDSNDDDTKGGRGRSGSRRPRRGGNQPRKEKQSTTSTSAKDADSSAGGKARDDKAASCSLVGVVESIVLLVPEAREDFQAVAAAVQANPAVTGSNSTRECCTKADSSPQSVWRQRVQAGSPGGAEPGGAETGGAEPWGAEPGGTEPGGAEPGGAGSARVASRGASSRREVLSPQELREWFARRWGRAAGAGGTTAAAGSGGTCPGSAGAAGPGGTAKTAVVGPTGGSAGASGGTGAAGSAGTGAAGATGVGAAGGVGAGETADTGTSEGAGAGAAGAGGATGAVPPAGSPGAVPAGSDGATRPRPYFVPLLEQVLGLPPSPGPSPPFECPRPVQSQSLLQPVSPLPAPSPYTCPTGGLAERRVPASRPASPARPACTSRRTSRPRPPAVPGTHQMTLRPSTAPLRVPLPSPPASSLPSLADPESDSLRAASPTVARFLATVVTDPSLASTAASALVAELVDFAARCRLDYAASLVAESASVCPPSVGGECALSTDVLEDRQEEFQCFAAALPHLVSTLLAPMGDPDVSNIIYVVLV